MYKPYRIGIESSILSRPRAGIGYYTANLVCHLARLPGDEEYTLLYNRPLPDRQWPSRLRHVLTGPASSLLWAQTRLQSICRQERIDLLHSPGQGIPLLYEGPSVLTLHDLSPLMFPQQKEFASRLIWNSLVPIMARKARHIITVSENTKKDVMTLLGIPEHRITRIYEAVSPFYQPVRDEARIKTFLHQKALEPGYILAVGTLEPRKQYPFLFRIFKKWLERSQSNATLVVIGKKGWLYEDIFRTLQNLRLQAHVRMEGYVHEEFMPLYYSAAQFSILTTAYEGFWFPGLESLACGTPVIAPKHSSIPEVVGDGGLLIDSWEDEAWLDAMDHLWMTPHRSAWEEKGIAQAKRFSWDRTARETLDVYRKVLQG